MKAEKISLDKAKTEKLFYFVVNAVVYRETDGKCLILKRSDLEIVHPGKYCVPGGKLEWGDLDIANPSRLNGDAYDFEHALENLLKREVREEAGIEIMDDIKYLSSVAFVRPDGVPVIALKFAALYKNGDAKLELNSFTDYAWVSAQEISAYDCIEGVAEEVIKTITLFK